MKFPGVQWWSVHFKKSISSTKETGRIFLRGEPPFRETCDMCLDNMNGWSRAVGDRVSGPPEHDPNIKKVSGRVSALNYFRGRFSSQAKLKHTCLGFMKSAPPVLLSQVDVLCQMGAAVLGHVTCLSVCVYLDHTWPLFVNRFVLPFKGSNPPEENQWSCSYR